MYDVFIYIPQVCILGNRMVIQALNWSCCKSVKPTGNNTQPNTRKGRYNDVIMSAMASQITSHTIVYSSVWSDVDQRKHQSSASLAFVRGIHRWPVNSPTKGPVTWKMFPFDDVIMVNGIPSSSDIQSVKYFCRSGVESNLRKPAAFLSLYCVQMLDIDSGTSPKDPESFSPIPLLTQCSPAYWIIWNKWFSDTF